MYVISELGERASVTLKPGATQELERPQTVPKPSKVTFGGKFNPYMTNGLAHHYQLGESTFNFRGVGSEFDYLFHFSMKFL